MKRGEEIVLRVGELTPQGDGLGRLEGREVVLWRAVPGDRVKARLVSKRQGRWEARIEEYLEQGMSRQAAPCPHFGSCGGCCWQDLAYVDQLALKEGMVRQALEERGLDLPPIAPILASPAPFFYRNKMEFSFADDGHGKVRLGLHLRGRFNRVFDVEDCRLQSEVANCLVEAARGAAAELGLTAYDLRTHQGVLRFLVVRESKNTGQLLVNLVVGEYPCAKVDALAEHLLVAVPEITTFLVTVHRGRAQVARGQEEFVLKGEGRIVEACGDLEFGISSQSFFQTNSLQVARLYQVIGEWAGDLRDCLVLDLYCGTGGISLSLASKGAIVLGVELAAEAVEDARQNARCNALDRCQFMAGAVEEVLIDLERQGRRFDLAVVDPPRAGVHAKALAALSRLRPPRLIYASCNPLTLAGDLEVLCQAGYGLQGVQPIDMFPQTPHCEAVVALKLD
jgi:23S rRNA (uracil1939-C5)-methyltransferase